MKNNYIFQNKKILMSGIVLHFVQICLISDLIVGFSYFFLCSFCCDVFVEVFEENLALYRYLEKDLSL